MRCPVHRPGCQCPAQNKRGGPEAGLLRWPACRALGVSRAVVPDRGHMLVGSEGEGSSRCPCGDHDAGAGRSTLIVDHVLGATRQIAVAATALERRATCTDGSSFPGSPLLVACPRTAGSRGCCSLRRKAAWACGSARRGQRPLGDLEFRDAHAATLLRAAVVARRHQVLPAHSENHSSRNSTRPVVQVRHRHDMASDGLRVMPSPASQHAWAPDEGSDSRDRKTHGSPRDRLVEADRYGLRRSRSDQDCVLESARGLYRSFGRATWKTPCRQETATVSGIVCSNL